LQRYPDCHRRRLTQPIASRSLPIGADIARIPKTRYPAFQAAIDARADFFELDVKAELSARL
jgi:glycerophosphoryl diester phosphodiesterase